MAQNDFGWGSSQWRNRPMSTEIGDHNEPFQYQRPQARDSFSRIEGPVSPRSTTGITPTVNQPPSALPPTGPTAQPPSALPPTAPIGQMPSPAWAGRPAPTEPVRQETVFQNPNDYREFTQEGPYPGRQPRTEPVGQETVMDADSFPGIPPATGRVTGWGPPLPAARTPPGIARSYPGRGPTIGYPGGPNPGPAVEIPRGAWLEQPRLPSYNRARQRFPSLRDLLSRTGQSLPPVGAGGPIPPARNRPWSTEAIGDQGDPSIPAPNLGRPNLYYGNPEPMEIEYQRRFDQFRRGGPGNAYGWGGRNLRRF